MTILTGAIPEVARPSYREGQFLSAADFVAEQDYHRLALGRHEIGNHTWGLVVGLHLEEVADPADAAFVDVFLTPGLAVDGYGRQLVAFSRTLVDPALFSAFTDVAHRSVWLQYAETSASPAAEGYADCADAQTTRVIETYRLLIDPVDSLTDVVVDGDVALPEGTPSPPAGIPLIPVDSSVPYQELPEEPPVARWLVRLGSLLWDGAARRFRPAGALLSQGRRYAGAIAAEVLAPAATLRIAQRTAPATSDAADFATVEGRLRVQGRINAERELWMEGDPIRFTLDDGNQPVDREITLGRATGAGTDVDQLRLTLGKKSTPEVSLYVATADNVADPLAQVRADGRVRVPLGPLDMGVTHRQEIELKTSAYGLGTQEGVLYQRSPSMFAWYAGGQHAETPLDPGKDSSGAQLVPRLVLDAEGSLDFGAVTHQILKLYTSTNGTYGIGVQGSTLYLRSNYDFCWFRKGVHSDTRSSAGTGGTLAMKLDDSSYLRVYGGGGFSSNVTVGAGGNAALISRHVNGKSGFDDSADHLYLNWNTGLDVYVGGGGQASDLDVSGGLRLRQAGQAAVESVIKVIKGDLQVANITDGTKGLPGSWSWSWTGLLDEVYSVFCVVNGLAMVTGQLFSSNPGRAQSTGSIPQNFWARVDGFDANHAWGQAFVAQSDTAFESDNSLAITVVAIGRKLP